MSEEEREYAKAKYPDSLFAGATEEDMWTMRRNLMTPEPQPEKESFKEGLLGVIGWQLGLIAGLVGTLFSLWFIYYIAWGAWT